MRHIINTVNIIKSVRWKLLLGVFKIKRIVRKWFGVRRLDYEPQDIFILTDTLREWETRARSVKKEPKTVAWIEQHGGVNAVLYDIGANVGAYSLIAASLGARVVAFEPAPQNIYRLHENILLNKLDEKIVVVPLVLALGSGVAKSFIKDRGFGSSHSFSLNEQSENGQTFLAMGLDTCVKTFSLPMPTMMKIDVDGAEMEILNGAQSIFNSLKLKHLLIEIDDSNLEIKKLITDMGFRYIDGERTSAWNANYIFERP